MTSALEKKVWSSMDKYRIRAVMSAAVDSVFIGIIAVAKGRAAILAAGGILIVAMSRAISVVSVVITINAALYKQVEAVQSISIVDPTLIFALVSILFMVTRMLLSRRNRHIMAQNGSLLLWFATFCVGISMGLAGPYSTQYGIDKLLRFMRLTGPLVFLASTWDQEDIEEYS